ncbi:MAG TPA: hypothetical protein VFZ18_06160 [Longimicrobiaceae bacterium]
MVPKTLLVALLTGTVALAAVGFRNTPQDPGLAAARLEAIASVRPRIRGGPVVLDASPLCTARLAQWRCPDPVAEALGRLDVVLGSRSFIHVCPEGTASCRLVGARHLMLVGRPSVRGRNARVDVEVISSRGEAGGQPLIRRGYQVHLVRRGAGWRVARVEGGS